MTVANAEDREVCIYSVCDEVKEGKVTRGDQFLPTAMR